MDFSKLNCSTSSYHNSTNTGPIYIFYTKKCNYFSRATRRNHSFLSKPQLKGCSDTLKLSGHVHCPVLYFMKYFKRIGKKERFSCNKNTNRNWNKIFFSAIISIERCPLMLFHVFEVRTKIWELHFTFSKFQPIHLKVTCLFI